jgi:DNA-binding LacI/PurR family transcriptional regulator
MSQSDPNDWVTAADVARLAGVSRSAVSRTFTEGASVSPDTREKVLRAAETLGYQVNMLARSMIQKQSNLVGVVVAGFDNPFLQTLLGPLTHHLALRSLAPLLMDASEPAQLAKSLRHLLQYRIAGVILASGAPPTDLAAEYLRLRIPVAMINRDLDLDGVDVVNSDNRDGAAQAARLLLAGGARHVRVLSSRIDTHSTRERLKGFQAALAPALQRGELTLSQQMASGAVYAAGLDAAREVLALDAAERPDSVFCVNDALACGFLDGVRNTRGLRVPEQLQVAGFDDIPMAGHAAYGLTTWRQDVDALAQRVVRCLSERMAEPGMAARLETVPVTLVARQTVRNAG